MTTPPPSPVKEPKNPAKKDPSPMKEVNSKIFKSPCLHSKESCENF
jgi:hypothetical protein